MSTPRRARRRMGSLHRRFVVAAVVSLFVAACGDSVTDSGGPSARSTSTTSTTTSTTVTSTTTSTATQPTPPVADGPDPAAPCSAWGLDRPADQTDLPAPVAATRAEVLTAALDCDFDRLDELASTGTAPFAATDVSDYASVPPGEFWADAEALGTDILAGIVHDLAQPPRFVDFDFDGVGPIFQWVDPDLCGDYDGHKLCRYVEIAEDGEWIASYRVSP